MRRSTDRLVWLGGSGYAAVRGFAISASEDYEFENDRRKHGQEAAVKIREIRRTRLSDELVLNWTRQEAAISEVRRSHTERKTK